MAATQGHTQSLHTNGRDEALALPSEEAARLALRTQQIIAHESGVGDFVDPLGGSYAIERITDELEEEALGLIKTVDEMGGMVPAIESGFPQREIQGAAYQTQRAIESGDQVVVGVNRFTTDEDVEPDLQILDPALEQAQVDRLHAFQAARDSAVATSAIDALKQAASGADNLMPHILHAVKSRCTLGEIAHALRDVFGVHTQNAL
ncbi:MAG: methylmalonyl-CoA mutase family protein, partial [Myxococcota bacterium]